MKKKTKIIIGILIAAVIAAAGITWYVMNQKNQKTGNSSAEVVAWDVDIEEEEPSEEKGILIPGYTSMVMKANTKEQTVTAEQSIERANKRVKHSTEEAFAETVKGYATVTTDNSSVQFHGGKAKYALYPVWLLNTTWNGNKYTFAMNGQTGKFVGDLPVDKGAAARWTVMLAAVFSVVTYGAAWLLHLIGLF